MSSAKVGDLIRIDAGSGWYYGYKYCIVKLVSGSNVYGWWATSKAKARHNANLINAQGIRDNIYGTRDCHGERHFTVLEETTSWKDRLGDL